MFRNTWRRDSESIVCVRFVQHFHVLTSDSSSIFAKEHFWWTRKRKGGRVAYCKGGSKTGSNMAIPLWQIKQRCGISCWRESEQNKQQARQRGFRSGNNNRHNKNCVTVYIVYSTHYKTCLSTARASSCVIGTVPRSSTDTWQPFSEVLWGLRRIEGWVITT